MRTQADGSEGEDEDEEEEGDGEGEDGEPAFWVPPGEAMGRRKKGKGKVRSSPGGLGLALGQNV